MPEGDIHLYLAVSANKSPCPTIILHTAPIFYKATADDLNLKNNLYESTNRA